MMRPGRDDDGSAASFVRGLTIGALVGAAVAGSSLWSRRRRAKRDRAAAGGAVMPIGDGSERSAGDASTMRSPQTSAVEILGAESDPMRRHHVDSGESRGD